MAVAKLLAIILFLSTVYANNSTERNKLVSAMDDAAAILKNPAIAASIEILKSIKSESSSSIGPRQDQGGFSKIHNTLDHSHGAVYVNKLDELMQLWLTDDLFALFPTEHKTFLSYSLKEYALQLQGDDYYKKKFDLSFNNGKGHLYLFTLIIAPHPTKPNAVKWEKSILYTDFIPAASYVIVTHSDCDIFSCDRHDEIAYMPIHVTNTHIDSIIDLNLKMMAQINQKMIN